MKINSKTKICMVIGDPIEHSLSPVMHNAGYKALKIDSEFVYVAFRVKIEEIEQVAKAMKVLGIRGASFTIPHKLEIMKYIDNIDPIAQKIGAVNTVVNENGVLKGFNTDWMGIVTPLERVTNIKNKKVALIGAGGAARAIAFAVTQKKGKLKIFNRTVGKAQELATDFNAESFSFEELSEISNADIIINATPIGMSPNINESPLPKDYLNKNQIVFDAVYNPMETKLLKDAKTAGAKIICGYEMLLYQGTTQFEMYTGHKAPEEEMRRALLENLKISNY